jgi:YbbR domain-containing protein
VLQALPYISTEPVDVTGLRADATRTVRLRLPAGIQSTRDSVTVRLRVAPVQGEITMVISLQLTSVPEGLRPFVQSPNLTLRLAGELPVLTSLTPANVKATVSLAGLSEGVHVLTPSITVPDKVSVSSIDPPQVTVSLQK